MFTGISPPQWLRCFYTVHAFPLSFSVATRDRFLACLRRQFWMGAMQLCHHHDRRVAKNRKLGFRGHVRSSKVAVDWERSCFALVSRRQQLWQTFSSFSHSDYWKYMPSRCAVLIWEAITILEAESQARVVDVLDSRSAESELGNLMI